MKKQWVALAALALVWGAAAQAQEQVVNLYSARHYSTDEALYNVQLDADRTLCISIGSKARFSQAGQVAEAGRQVDGHRQSLATKREPIGAL